MDTLKIAEKLEPIMPKQIRHWLSVRDMADTDLRSLIDKQIMSTAHQVLGDFRNKILLSLPSEKKSRGSFNLGTLVYEQDKWQIGISKSELLQNLLIVGRSGAGKTNLSFHLLKQLSDKKIPFLFLDWKRTARHLLPHLENKVNVYTPGRQLAKFSFNPFVPPPNLEHHVYINHVVDTLAASFTLGDGSKSIMQKALNSCYQSGNRCPLITDIIKAVDNLPSTGRQGNWKITALRALDSLQLAGIGTAKTSSKELLYNITKVSSIIELDSLSQNCKEFLVPLICLWLYQVKLTSTNREKLSFVIFIEEAHHVLHHNAQRSKETLMEMLLRQCRELGIAMVIIDQHPSLISPVALGNTYTSICLNLKNPTDINKAASISLLDSEEKQYFSMLPIGSGIVKLQDRWRKPFLVRFPLLQFKKGFVTDQMVSRYSGSGWRNTTLSMRKTPELYKSGGITHFQASDTIWKPKYDVFLRDVAEHRHNGVKERYQRLGISAGTGNDIKKQLIQMGLIQEQRITTAQTHKTLLKLTSAGEQILNSAKGIPGNESIEHEYWKAFYVKHFKSKGYKVNAEVLRASGRTDLVAIKPGKAIAIEIETGKSDVVQNIKQNMLEGYNPIVVVATNKTAFCKVEERIAQASLLIPNRVKIVLQDKGTSLIKGSPLETVEELQDAYPGTQETRVLS